MLGSPKRPHQTHDKPGKAQNDRSNLNRSGWGIRPYAIDHRQKPNAANSREDGNIKESVRRQAN